MHPDVDLQTIGLPLEKSTLFRPGLRVKRESYLVDCQVSPEFNQLSIHDNISHAGLRAAFLWHSMQRVLPKFLELYEATFALISSPQSEHA